jgi:hypothetical protein
LAQEEERGDNIFDLGEIIKVRFSILMEKDSFKISLL